MLQLNCRMSPSFSQSQLLLLRPPCPLVCPASNDPATNGTQPTNHIAHKPAQSPLIAPSSWPANPRMSPVRLQSLSKPPCIPIIPVNRRQTIYLHRRPPVLPISHAALAIHCHPLIVPLAHTTACLFCPTTKRHPRMSNHPHYPLPPCPLSLARFEPPYHPHMPFKPPHPRPSTPHPTQLAQYSSLRPPSHPISFLVIKSITHTHQTTQNLARSPPVPSSVPPPTHSPTSLLFQPIVLRPVVKPAFHSLPSQHPLIAPTHHTIPYHHSI